MKTDSFESVPSRHFSFILKKTSQDKSRRRIFVEINCSWKDEIAVNQEIYYKYLWAEQWFVNQVILMEWVTYRCSKTGRSPTLAEEKQLFDEHRLFLPQMLMSRSVFEIYVDFGVLLKGELHKSHIYELS